MRRLLTARIPAAWTENLTNLVKNKDHGSTNIAQEWGQFRSKLYLNFEIYLALRDFNLKPYKLSRTF
jgi:hypothetical protein